MNNPVLVFIIGFITWTPIVLSLLLILLLIVGT